MANIQVRHPASRLNLRLVPWLLCVALLALLALQSGRPPGSAGNHTTLTAASGCLGQGSQTRGTTAAAVSRAVPALVAGVNETIFWPEDWWDFQAAEPQQAFPRCARLVCDFRADCTSGDRSCCAYWLRGLLEFVAAFFPAHGLRWLITYGTLLGAVRSQSIIPWTKDLDIGVLQDGWDQLTAMDDRRLRREAWRYGFMVHPGLPNSATRLCYHPGHPELAPPSELPRSAFRQTHHTGLPAVYADLYLLLPLGRSHNQYKFTLHEDSWRTVNASFATYYTIDGLTVPGLDNASACLQNWYGPDFMVPKITY